MHAASATFHSSPRIMLAALKFFLGQDQVPEGEEDESSEDEEDGDIKALGPTRAEFYKANKKVWTVLLCLHMTFCPDDSIRLAGDQDRCCRLRGPSHLYSDPVSALNPYLGS